MSQMETANPLSGTARLAIVVPVAMLSFFYATVLEYLLPLYFSAMSEAAQARGSFYPEAIYSQLMKYQVTPWIIGPVLAGLLSRRYGERRVWAFAQLAMVLVPAVLLFEPSPTMVKVVAFWSGLTGALMWIGGVSLVQMVEPHRKGLSNGLMMASMGVGSLVGPILSRAMLYQRELLGYWQQGDFSQLTRMSLALETPSTKPGLDDFLPVFYLLIVIKLVCGILVGFWGQRPGRFAHDDVSPGWAKTIFDLRRLVVNPRFWALVIALCVLGGPIFQSANLFLPYRAEAVGLKSGSADEGWVWVQLLRTFMWIVGGLSVGLVAGRRAPGLAAVIMLGCFALGALGIGASWIGWQLFVAVAFFEFFRQFIRWSHAGYMSEHMPPDLRATAIGLAITFSGLGSVLYAWPATYFWNADAPGFDSADPFYAAAVLGLIGCAGLLIFDRFCPIRQPEWELQGRPEPAESDGVATDEPAAEDKTDGAT